MNQPEERLPENIQEASTSSAGETIPLPEPPEGTPPELSFFEKTMRELGATPDLLRTTVANNDFALPAARFSETESGGIKILYKDLLGRELTWKGNDRKWIQHFHRERLHPSQVTDSRKYWQPGGSGIEIYLTDGIIEKYQAGQKIETLYLVEGEKKAFAGWMAGLDIIGLPGVRGYHLGSEKQLHPTLTELIRVCRPQRLVLIYDADVLKVNWSKWAMDPDTYDLGKRLNDFYTHVKDFREMAAPLVNDVYFADLSGVLKDSFKNAGTAEERVIENPFKNDKGLDDLLCHYLQKPSNGCRHLAHVHEVVTDLERLATAHKFFNIQNIKTQAPTKLREYFMLPATRNKPPKVFYLANKERIKDTEFVFCGFRYKYSPEKEDLEFLAHPDSQKFIRVGCDYIKLIIQVDARENVTRKLEPWKIGEINRDYVDKGFKNFVDTIPKFDTFCNVPSHNGSYKQVVMGCYNLYYQIEWKPEEGPCEASLDYLHHLFGPHYEIALDYLAITFREPTQLLPILALVSEERGTGKTTFLNWLREIYGENCTILGNDEITDRFNDDYASKLFICIDEGFIEKKATQEKLKSWSTARKIKLSAKFASRKEIDFFGKIIITSNEVDSFIQIDPKETRYWVVKPPQFKKEDPDLLTKLRDEIPAFLWMLKKHEIKHPKRTRHWFDYELIKTDALRAVIDNTRSYPYKTIVGFIRKLFFELEEIELKADATLISQLIGNPRITPDLVERILKNDFGLITSAKPERYKFPYYNKVMEGAVNYSASSDGFVKMYTTNKRDLFPDNMKMKDTPLIGRVYTLKAEQFLKPEEISDEMRSLYRAIEEVPF